MSATPRAPDDVVADLLAYLDRSPTPYHAVAEGVRRLQAAGFREAPEGELWQLEPGDRRYLVRQQGSLAAFQVGALPAADTGFRVIAAHSDSPNLRLKPRPDRLAHGCRQLGVEPYGGVLLHSWLDRDLSLAGRVTLAQGSATRSELLDFGRPLLRIPNLAIHLQRELATQGLKLDPQTQLIPVSGLRDGPELAELVCAELRAQGRGPARAQDLLAFDLMTCDVQPAALSGARGEFLCGSRLDNLVCCHAALRALCDAGSAPPPPFTRAVVLYDHEEVGSRSARGAAGPLLSELLERVVVAAKGAEPQAVPRALARSWLVSADMAHAVHPNFADKHDPEHRPLLGRGPVLKVNAGQAYASDAESAGFFAALCGRAGVTPQHFVSRSDMPCGSTVGPISAARVGIRCVDVGSPMWAMHSCRETAGSADVEPMIAVLRAFFEGG